MPNLYFSLYFESVIYIVLYEPEEIAKMFNVQPYLSPRSGIMIGGLKAKMATIMNSLIESDYLFTQTGFDTI